MIADLVEFLRTGKLAFLACNVSLEEAVSALGSPAEQYTGVGGELCMTYGDLTVVFHQNLLESIYLYFRNAAKPRIPASLSLQMPRDLVGVSVKQFKGFLEEAKIAFRIHPGLTNDEQVTFETGERWDVKTFFSLNPERLDSIAFTRVLENGELASLRRNVPELEKIRSDLDRRLAQLQRPNTQANAFRGQLLTLDM